MVIVIMGVAGVGKTTVGRALAADLGWAFHDADALHAPDAIAQMARGEPLTEAQRQPWLRRVRDVIGGLIEQRTDAVLACSALRQQYRDVLSGAGPGVRFVFLDADPQVVRERLASRDGHFAKGELLDSQLATLEPPEDAVTLDAALPVATLVRQIRTRFESSLSRSQ
jgi:gluconokinase